MIGTLVVAMLLLAGAGWLFARAAAQRREWGEHARQVQVTREWHLVQAAAPYSQVPPAPPEVTSPYAGPPGDPDVPPLPEQPGTVLVIWGWVLVAVGLLCLAAALTQV